MRTSRKLMVVALAASAITVGIVTTSVLFAWLPPVQPARSLDVGPVRLGFAIPVREQELQGIDEAEVRAGSKDPPFAARWFPLRDNALWYATESEKTSLESDPAAFFQSIGLIGIRRDDTCYVLIHTSSDMSMWAHDMNWNVETAFMTIDGIGRPAMVVELDDRGAGLLNRLSTPHVGEPLAVIIDDHVLHAPVISGPIDRLLILKGNFTYEQIEQLVRALAGR